MRVPGLDTARRTLWVVATSIIVPSVRRHRLLQFLGLKGVQPSLIYPEVSFANPGAISAGTGCEFNRGTFFDAGPITIGRNVSFGPKAMIITGNHPIGDARQRASPGTHAAVTIGEGTWIGAGAIVLPGITIGAGCVIGAGSVVTRDCAPHGVYVGSPARRIRDLPVDGQTLNGT